jgi:hypothetical protein
MMSYVEQEAAASRSKSEGFRPLHLGSFPALSPMTSGLPRESIPAIKFEPIHLSNTVPEAVVMPVPLIE